MKRLNDYKLSRKVSADSKTRFDEAHFSMLNNVVAFALNPANVGITTSIPAYNTSITNIQGNLTTYLTVKGLANLPITGYAVQKENYRLALIMMLGNGMQAVYTYADAVNDAVLADQMRMAPSTLERMTFASLLNTAAAVISTVSPLAAAGTLTSYNVTSASVAAWQAIWNQLNTSFSDPKNAIAARVALNTSAYSLLHDSMVILTNQCDTLVRQITDTKYLASYYSSRKLNEHHVSTQLRIHVEDAIGNAVTNGEVFILGTDRNAFLDSNGYALVDHIPFGRQTVTVTTPAGSENYGPYDFKKGKSITLHVQIGEFSTESNVTVTEKEVIPTDEKTSEK